MMPDWVRGKNKKKRQPQNSARPNCPPLFQCEPSISGKPVICLLVPGYDPSILYSSPLHFILSRKMWQLKSIMMSKGS